MLYQVALLDEDKRRFNYVSKVAEELYGSTLSEIKQNPDLIYSKVHPDDVGDLIAKEQEALKTMSVFETEARMINADGSIRWSYLISKPRIIDGVTCFDGLELNITKKKQLEFELIKAKERAEESEARFKQIANHSHAWEVFRNEKDELIYSSPAFERITGYSHEDYIAGKITRKDIFHPDDYDAIIVELHKILNHETVPSHECRVVRKDSTVIYVEIEAQPVFQKDKYIGFRASVRDITERKNQEEDILRSNQQLQLINDFTSEILKISEIADIYKFISVKISELFPNTVVLCNSIDEKANETIFQSYSGIDNKLFNKVLSVTGFNPVGKTYKLVKSHEDFLRTGKLQHFSKGLTEFSANEFPAIAAKAIEKLIGISNIYSIGVLKEDNLIASLQLFSYNKSAISAKEFLETFVYHAGIVLQKKILEIQLTESEAQLKESNATKDKFFSIIAHDLKGPLSPIIAFSDMLLEEHNINDEEERKGILKLINTSAKNTFKLLENLLTWSSLQTGKIDYVPEKIHLKLILFEVFTELQGQAKNKHIHLIDKTSESDLIFADVNMTKTVL